jgi:hypothetical protein
MNEVLHFLRTQNNGDSFFDCLAKYEKIYNRKDHPYRINCAEQIYSHALKYRHFIFFEYFMHFFTTGWEKGLACLLKSNIKHSDFLHLFQKFKKLCYFNNNDCQMRFTHICNTSTPFILKQNTWNWFEKYPLLWDSKTKPIFSYLSLLYTSITFKICLNKYIQLLDKCSKNIEIEKKFIIHASQVFYEKILQYYYNGIINNRLPYAEVLLMYGAGPGVRLHNYELKSCQEYYEKVRHRAFTIILFYCFERRSVQLMF